MHIQPKKRAQFISLVQRKMGLNPIVVIFIFYICKTFGKRSVRFFSFSRKMTWFIERPNYEIYDNWTGTWERASNLTNIRFSPVNQRDGPKNSAKLTGKRKGSIDNASTFLLTLFKVAILLRTKSPLLSPSQNVWFPLQEPFAWHFLDSEPLSINPSSHRNSIWFENVVSDPSWEPLLGTGRGPQFLAEGKSNQYLSWISFSD